MKEIEEKDRKDRIARKECQPNKKITKKHRTSSSQVKTQRKSMKQMIKRDKKISKQQKISDFVDSSINRKEG